MNTEDNKTTNSELELQIKSASSKNLAGYVIVYRTLGLYKELASKCMAELLNRRNAGDNFNFEEYIENEIKTMPKPNNLNKLKNIFKIT